jgi:hypothetical protein
LALAAIFAAPATPGMAGDADAPAPGSFASVIANNPISAIAKGPNLWTRVEEPKDWVKASRPKQPAGFMPVGVTPPPRRLKIKTPAELAAMQADLEATDKRVQALNHRKPVLVAGHALTKKRKPHAAPSPAQDPSAN